MHLSSFLDDVLVFHWMVQDTGGRMVRSNNLFVDAHFLSLLYERIASSYSFISTSQYLA